MRAGRFPHALQDAVFGLVQQVQQLGGERGAEDLGLFEGRREGVKWQQGKVKSVSAASVRLRFFQLLFGFLITQIHLFLGGPPPPPTLPPHLLQRHRRLAPLQLQTRVLRP